MTIDRLHPVVVHHVVNTLGWQALRPLQEQAIDPLLDGEDALLLAPTAGGKTEAAAFPLLSRMTAEHWRGVSVLYVCPLRALLNNLEPRIDAYAQWLGRRAALWHGDTTQGRRRQLRGDRPDVLLTTPESLESMLVSTQMSPRDFFADVRAVVVDEVHAFAGDDRGWHLLAVLERLEGVAGRRIQRVGLSATVGNPRELLTWLQGSGAGKYPSKVVAPDVDSVRVRPGGDVTLDHVGSLSNAGKVLSLMHTGEKRLVFCESRREVEDLAQNLRMRGVETYVSHSSLSIDERRRAEHAFADSRDCVIVSTSTLELGIDVGDLDRVIQIDAPRTVASFLQRLGRSGRRAGTSRSALFLTTTTDGLLRASGLLHLWSEGFVEPVLAPPSPRHIVAQQVLALCLQEGRVGDATWESWWHGLPIFDERSPEIVAWLVGTGHLESDGGMLFIGPEAEAKFGRRNFMDLLSVFTASPEFVVQLGRQDLGSIDPIVLTRKTEGPRVIVLAGRSWMVTSVDWRRRRCYVEPYEGHARMRWTGGAAAQSFAMCRAQRDVVLGTDPAVTVSRRAGAGLEELRENRARNVTPGGLVVTADGDDLWWWTWAGARANATVEAAISDVAHPDRASDDYRIPLRAGVSSADLAKAAETADVGSARPGVDAEMIRGLKFADVLPPKLAVDTLASRLVDKEHAATVVREQRKWVHR